MSIRIGVLQRVVERIRVVVALRIAQVWNNSIRLNEAPKVRIVIPRAVVVQPGFPVKDLASEPTGDLERRLRRSGLAAPERIPHIAFERLAIATT